MLDFPLALKPTFVNMDVEFEHFSIINFVVYNSWDHQMLDSFFGAGLNSLVIDSGTINSFGPNGRV